jgi:hypothetical protein
VAVNVTAIVATGGGGGAMTVTDVAAVTPSTCTVTVPLPTPTAVTQPVLLTAAMAGFELDQLTARSASTTPLASRTTAESCALSPTVSDRLVGVRATDAAVTAVTATAADAVNPSADAWADVLPTVIAVTPPDAVTAATALFALDHVMTWFGITVPVASRTSALS